MDAMRWAQVLQLGFGKHAYHIAPEIFQSFGKVRPPSTSNYNLYLIHV